MSKTLFEYALIHKWTVKKEEYQELLEKGEVFAESKVEAEKIVIRSEVALDYEVDELIVLVRPFS